MVVDSEIKCDTPNTKLPVVALLALADHVKLGILPCSHKVVAINKCDSLCAATEYILKVGEIIVLHPLLVHYGCAYTANEKSLRLHFYFDNDQLVRVVGKGKLRTFFFRLLVQSIPYPPVVKPGQIRKQGNGNSKSYTKTKRLRPEEQLMTSQYKRK